MANYPIPAYAVDEMATIIHRGHHRVLNRLFYHPQPLEPLDVRDYTSVAGKLVDVIFLLSSTTEGGKLTFVVDQVNVIE